MSKKPIPLPIPVEEESEEECPKCPPVGAPAWMATFADMATLLMAFFVLILSFAEFNQPKFKMVAGSLKNAFGVQREVPVVEQPKGTTLLELTFSPSPEPSVTKEITQDTTEFDRKEIEQKTSNSPDEGNGSQGDGADQALADAIADALASGQVQVKTEDGKVVMSFEGDTESPTELAEQIQDAAQAIEQAKASGASTSDVQLEGLADALPQLAEMTGQDSGSTGGESEGTGTPADGESERKAAIAEAELRVALREEVSQGLVTVEQEENKVKITVGAGGAFRSGKADLTDEARDIMARLAFASMGEASDIVITGHTDDVPVSSGSEFRDNWGLAAGRASSVLREFSDSGLIDPSRLQAISRGETMPVADNTTPEGREKNRRIEIEINY